MKRTTLALLLLAVAALPLAADNHPGVTLRAGATMAFESSGWNRGTETDMTSVMCTLAYGPLFGGAGVDFSVRGDGRYDAHLRSGFRIDLKVIQLSVYGLVQRGVNYPEEEKGLTLSGAGSTLDLNLFGPVGIYADYRLLSPLLYKSMGYRTRPTAGCLSFGLNLHF